MTPAPTKRQVFESALDVDVWMHLDPRRVGVVVPAHLGREPRLVLQFSRQFPVPMRDLVIDDDGVRVTLSFDRRPHRVIVPWSAVFGIVTHEARVFVWEGDLPREESWASKPKPKSN